MSTKDVSWADFTHTTQTSTVSPQELLERYREFKGFIASLPRRCSMQPIRRPVYHHGLGMIQLITGPKDGPPDGLVGILDFLNILTDWGTCPP